LSLYWTRIRTRYSRIIRIPLFGRCHDIAASYVWQAFQPILETPVMIRDADRPIGTHVFTAMEPCGMVARHGAFHRPL
jgi:hypothetical protein